MSKEKTSWSSIETKQVSHKVCPWRDFYSCGLNEPVMESTPHVASRMYPDSSFILVRKKTVRTLYKGPFTQDMEVLANAACKKWNTLLPMGVFTQHCQQHRRICVRTCLLDLCELGLVLGKNVWARMLGLFFVITRTPQWHPVWILFRHLSFFRKKNKQEKHQLILLFVMPFSPVLISVAVHTWGCIASETGFKGYGVNGTGLFEMQQAVVGDILGCQGAGVLLRWDAGEVRWWGQGILKLGVRFCFEGVGHGRSQSLGMQCNRSVRVHFIT